MSKITFKLEPATLEIYIDDEPDQLYIPGAISILTNRPAWRAARFDFDTKTYYIERDPVGPHDFRAKPANDKS